MDFRRIDKRGVHVKFSRELHPDTPCTTKPPENRNFSNKIIVQFYRAARAFNSLHHHHDLRCFYKQQDGTQCYHCQFPSPLLGALHECTRGSLHELGTVKRRMTKQRTAKSIPSGNRRAVEQASSRENHMLGWCLIPPPSPLYKRISGLGNNKPGLRYHHEWLAFHAGFHSNVACNPSRLGLIFL